MDELKKRDHAPEQLWTPAYLTIAAEEARKFLNEVQYLHAVTQVLMLCEEEDPTHPCGLDVDAVEDFYELRDKYGVLGKINLRIFFYVCNATRTVVVLGAWNKRVDGQTPVRIVRRIRARKRRAETQLRESARMRNEHARSRRER